MARKNAKRGASRNVSSGNNVSMKMLMFVFGLIVMFFATAVLYLYRDEFYLNLDQFPVKTIKLESPLENVTEQEIRTVVTQYADEGFFRIDVEGIRKDLEKKEWVDVAVVKREWPDKVVVRVVERIPVAFWGESALVDKNGKVFNPELTDSRYRNLPIFKGPDKTSEIMLDNYLLMKRKAKQIEQEIVELEMSDRRAWKMVFKNGLHIELGRDDISNRFTRFKDVYASTIAKFVDVIELVDMRYTNGFAVRWREGAQPVIHG